MLFAILLYSALLVALPNVDLGINSLLLRGLAGTRHEESLSGR